MIGDCDKCGKNPCMCGHQFLGMESHKIEKLILRLQLIKYYKELYPDKSNDVIYQRVNDHLNDRQVQI